MICTVLRPLLFCWLEYGLLKPFPQCLQDSLNVCYILQAVLGKMRLPQVGHTNIVESFRKEISKPSDEGEWTRR